MNEEDDKIEPGDVRTKIVRPHSMSPTVRLKPHIGVILADAHTIISEELRALRAKVQRGEGLDRHDLKKFTTYADAFAKLAREEREQEKRNDVTDIPDEDLLELMAKATKILGK